MKPKCAALLLALLPCVATTATAADKPFLSYVEFGAVSGQNKLSFGGTNTAGSFNNTDTQNFSANGAAIAIGFGTDVTVFGKTFQPELEYTRYGQGDVTSASFPGLPSPSFFYDTQIERTRLSANFWSTHEVNTDWNVQGGLGLGVMRTEASTNDTVVSGTETSYAPSLMLGAQALRNLGENGQIVFGLRAYFVGNTNIDLMSGGSDGGNLSFKQSSAEVRIGYRLNFN